MLQTDPPAQLTADQLSNLVPGGVGGTEIYLPNLIAELAALDTPHAIYVVFTSRETRLELGAANVEDVPAAVPGRIRPARLLWEQTVLPWQARCVRLDILLNTGFTAPLAASCPQVTVFHDMQHKRYSEHFRRLDLLAWRLFLYAAARRSRLVLADSEETWRDLRRYCRRVPTASFLIEPLRSIGGDATVQFDPWQQDAIRGAAAGVCDETLRADLSRRGPERAAPFPWRATAVKTLSALEEAAGPRAFVRHPRPDPVTR